ncbi:hypothetical protein SHKM778_02840 [Streptomyces sp. KM77-8]|uniref:Uncharacterized protein n=1 Tax=Streptomyces haneummycinicus TaxID=3074435 RepID=A0AAT9H955_9ACTN
MLPEPPVVQPQDEPQPGVEPAGGQRGTDVDLVVVVHQRQRGGPLHAHLGEYGLGRFGGLHDPFAGGQGVVGTAAAPVDGGHDPAEQRRGDRAGPPHHRLPYAVPGRRYDEDDLLAVHLAQLGGEPVGESVVTAHHHVCRRVAGRGGVGKEAHHRGETASS